MTRKRRLVFAFAGALGGSFALWSSQNYVRSNEFGLRESFGFVSPEILKPGLYVNAPYPFQYTHSYNAGVQRIEFNAGSCRFIPVCENTQDRNVLMANMILSYKVIPDGDKLAMRPWSMQAWGKADGYWLITTLMNESANVAFGPSSLEGIVSKPNEFLARFSQDFVDRLTENRIPIAVDQIELRGFRTSPLYPPHFITQERLTKANIPAPSIPQ